MGKKSDEDVGEGGRLLDGFFLLAAAGQQSPDLVITAHVAGLGLIDVASEDLAYFVNLQSLDLADNELSYSSVLEQLNTLPRVNRISLACNLISSLVLNEGEMLQDLQELDLSFNELHGDVLTQLSSLRRLRKLDLSNNCVSSIPPDLGGLNSLRDLNLAANDLVQFDQWRALDSLPSLQVLNLALNRIKRLQDDTAGGSGSMFRSLLELDLSNNEFRSHEALVLVQSFPKLHTIYVTGNVLSPKDKHFFPAEGQVRLVYRPSTEKAKGFHNSLKVVRKKRIAAAPERKPGVTGVRKIREALFVPTRHHAMDFAEDGADLYLGEKEVADVLKRSTEGGDPMLLTEELDEQQIRGILQQRLKALELPSGAEPSSFLRLPDFDCRKVVSERLKVHMRKNEPDTNVESTFITESTRGEEATGTDMRWRRGIEKRTESDVQEMKDHELRPTGPSDQERFSAAPGASPEVTEPVTDASKKNISDAFLALRAASTHAQTSTEKRFGDD
jgi:hypothetical protein